MGCGVLGCPARQGEVDQQPPPCTQNHQPHKQKENLRTSPAIKPLAQVGSGLPLAVGGLAIAMGLNLLGALPLRLPSLDLDARGANVPPALQVRGGVRVCVRQRGGAPPHVRKEGGNRCRWGKEGACPASQRRRV